MTERRFRQADDRSAVDLLVYLCGRNLAQEMLLRWLITARCVATADPERTLFEAIEGLIGSMDKARRPEDTPEVTESAIESLREFASQVEIRLRNCIQTPARDEPSGGLRGSRPAATRDDHR